MYQIDSHSSNRDLQQFAEREEEAPDALPRQLLSLAASSLVAVVVLGIFFLRTRPVMVFVPLTLPPDLLIRTSRLPAVTPPQVGSLSSSLLDALTEAQQSLPFPILLPTALPSGLVLQSVDSLMGDATSDDVGRLLLTYRYQPKDAYDEAVDMGTVTLEEREADDSFDTSVPAGDVEEVEVRGVPGGCWRGHDGDVHLWWQRDAVSYHITTSAPPAFPEDLAGIRLLDRDQLLEIARSIP